jgi:hypothetical protein
VEVSSDFGWSVLQESAFVARRCACCVSGYLLCIVWADLESYHGRDIWFGFVFVMYVMYVKVTVRSKLYPFS